MGTFDEFNKKEKPVFTGSRFGFGSGGGGAAADPIGITATGGSKFTNSGYTYHFYTGTGPKSFNVSSLGDDASKSFVQFMLVAGGGGNGANNGAGGGGGALYSHPDVNFAVTVQNYPLVVGAGGAGTGTPSAAGSPGGDTTGFGYGCRGGGGGGSGTSGNGGTSSNPGVANYFGGSGGGQSGRGYSCASE